MHFSLEQSGGMGEPAHTAYQTSQGPIFLSRAFYHVGTEKIKQKVKWNAGTPVKDNFRENPHSIHLVQSEQLPTVWITQFVSSAHKCLSTVNPNHFAGYKNIHWYFWLKRMVLTAHFAVDRGRTILSIAIRHIRLTVKQAVPCLVFESCDVMHCKLNWCPPAHPPYKNHQMAMCPQIALFYCI